MPPDPTRPHFPPGYLPEPPTEFVPWEEVTRRLSEARNYWLATVRPNGRPHTVPVWGVWLDEALYYDGSPQTRHARNLAANPNIAVHLESGDEVLVVEGTAAMLDRPPVGMGERLAAEYRRKYAAEGYAPDPAQWDAGGLYEVRPRQILTWTVFNVDPTRYRFESQG